MKKILVFLSIFFVSVFLVSCGEKNTSSKTISKSNEKQNIEKTIKNSENNENETGDIKDAKFIGEWGKINRDGSTSSIGMVISDDGKAKMISIMKSGKKSDISTFVWQYKNKETFVLGSTPDKGIEGKWSNKADVGERIDVSGAIYKRIE